MIRIPNITGIHPAIEGFWKGAGSMPSGIIDIHPHIVSKDSERYPITPLEGKRSDWSQKRSVDLGEMVDAMDEAGVGKAALVHSSTTYGYDCSYVADSVAREPERFTGVFSVN